MRMEKEQKNLVTELEKYKKPMERMFYVFFAINFVYDMLTYTMMFVPLENLLLKPLALLPIDLILPALETILNLRLLIVIPAAYTVFFEMRKQKQQAILIALLFVGWFYAMYWRKDSDLSIFCPLLLIVAAAGRNMKKMAKIALISGISVMGLAFILSQIGVIEDIVWQRVIGEGRGRHAFGMTYCTDLAAHVLYFILLYMLMVHGKMKWWGYALITVLTVINIVFVDGRIALACTVLAVMGCVFLHFYDKHQWKIPEALMVVWKWLLTWSFVLGAGFMFLLSVTYKKDPEIWYNRYVFFGGRLYTNYRLLKTIPFSWFGTSFYQSGWGGKTEEPAYYFWVDCSYTRLYAMYGIVAFLIFMALLTWIQIRLKKRKAYFAMYLMALVALDCMMEHHMTEVAFNIFLLMAFCDLDKVPGIGEERLERCIS